MLNTLAECLNLNHHHCGGVQRKLNCSFKFDTFKVKTFLCLVVIFNDFGKNKYIYSYIDITDIIFCPVVSWHRLIMCFIKVLWIKQGICDKVQQLTYDLKLIID